MEKIDFSIVELYALAMANKSGTDFTTEVKEYKDEDGNTVTAFSIKA